MKKINLVINEDLLAKLLKLKTSGQLRATLFILNAPIVEQNNLSKAVRISVDKLDDVLHLAGELGLIERMVIKATREVHYVASKGIVPIELKCHGCKFSKERCKASFECVHMHSRLVYITWKELNRIRKTFTLSQFEKKMVRHKTGERRVVSGLVDDWEFNDFVDFMWYQYGVYDHLITITKVHVRRFIVQMKKAFQIEFEDNWKLVLKHYIVWLFSNDQIPSLKKACDRFSIQNFIDKVPIHTYRFCQKYKMYCPWWKSTCSYNGKCNSGLRNKIRKHYN